MGHSKMGSPARSWLNVLKSSLLNKEYLNPSIHQGNYNIHGLEFKINPFLISKQQLPFYQDGTQCCHLCCKTRSHHLFFPHYSYTDDRLERCEAAEAGLLLAPTCLTLPPKCGDR